MTGAKSYHAHKQTQPSFWSRRPAWQWALLGGGALVGLGVLTMLALLLLAPGEVSPRGTRSAVGVEQEMEGAMMELDRAPATRGLARPDVSLSVSDADMNDYLNKSQGDLGLPMQLHEPRLAFGEGDVTASARAKLWVLPVQVTAQVTPTASRGRLHVAVASLRVGLLSVPARYRERVETAAQNAINSGLSETKFNLEALEITPGRAALTLRPPPSL
jgi:hypothetical protein